MKKKNHVQQKAAITADDRTSKIEEKGEEEFFWGLEMLKNCCFSCCSQIWKKEHAGVNYNYSQYFSQNLCPTFIRMEGCTGYCDEWLWIKLIKCHFLRWFESRNILWVVWTLLYREYRVRCSWVSKVRTCATSVECWVIRITFLNH